MTRQQLLQSAKSLPKEERIDLVMDLWETIEGNDAPLTDAQKRELDRRTLDDSINPQPAEKWQDLRAKLLGGEI